jgi:hypothetical protein
MDVTFEVESPTVMRYLCFCLGCGGTGFLHSAKSDSPEVEENKEVSCDQASGQRGDDGRLCAFLLVKSCSRCGGDKAYHLSDCEFFSRLKVGCYLLEFIGATVSKFVDDVDFIEKYGDSKHDGKAIVDGVVKNSEESFTAELGQMECTEVSFDRERRVPCFWKEAVEGLFNIYSVIGLEDGDSEESVVEELSNGVDSVQLEN